jgi:hypothetical protein
MNALEELAVWYLRLNGYFVIPNFIAHGRRSAQTDVDVLAVRFPHSEEYPDDVDVLQIPPGKTDVVFAEVKRGLCAINGPWKCGGDGKPLEYVLKRVGLLEPLKVQEAANELCAHRRYPPGKDLAKSAYVIRIACFGSFKNGSLADVTQIMWPKVTAFIGNRFNQHPVYKADHDHWDRFGKFLWDSFEGDRSPTFEELVEGWHHKCSCWP